MSKIKPRPALFAITLLVSVAICFVAVGHSRIKLAENVTQHELNTATYVLTEYCHQAESSKNVEGVIIIKNAFNQLARYGNVDSTHSRYFESIGGKYAGKKVLISTNKAPSGPISGASIGSGSDNFQHGLTQGDSLKIVEEYLKDLGLNRRQLRRLIAQFAKNGSSPVINSSGSTINNPPATPSEPENSLDVEKLKEEYKKLSPAEKRQLEELLKNK